MSGFYLEFNPKPVLAPQLHLIDLGQPDLLHAASWGGARSAWTRWKISRQLHIIEHPKRFTWIAGAPDRIPGPEEQIADWRAGRSGTFHGFSVEHEAGRVHSVTLFVDPLASRPIYYTCRDGGLFASDKLATLVANLSPALCVDTAVIVEEVLLNTIFSEATTLEAVTMMRPGEMLEFREGVMTKSSIHPMPADPNIDPEAVRRDPVGTLETALRISVQDCWRNPDATLLMSGGLDSRICLILAGPGRRALTVTTRPNCESEIASRIAAACSARFTHQSRPPEHYFGVLRRAHLLTGACWDPIVAHHLGMGAGWRASGIGEVIHAYQFDATIKGNRLVPASPYLDPATPLASWLGPRAVHFSGAWMTRKAKNSPETVMGLLNDEARAAAQRRLAAFAAMLEPCIEDRLNLAAERILWQAVARGPSYPQVLSWFEEVDVNSPIYQPAFWSWHRASRPRDRYLGASLRRLLMSMDHPGARVPDANTGGPIRLAPIEERLQPLVRSLPGYPLLRGLWRPLIGAVKNPRPAQAGPRSYPDQASWPPFAPLFRTGEGRAALQEGMAPALRRLPLDTARVEDAFQRYLSGEDWPLDALLAISSAGRWLEFVEAPAAAGQSQEFLHSFALQHGE